MVKCSRASLLVLRACQPRALASDVRLSSTHSGFRPRGKWPQPDLSHLPSVSTTNKRSVCPSFPTSCHQVSAKRNRTKHPKSKQNHQNHVVSMSSWSLYEVLTFGRVESVDLLAEPLRDHVSLGLERLCDEPVGGCEGFEFMITMSTLREETR